MKKLMAVICALSLLFSGTTAYAEAASSEVYVTIADQNGKLALSYEKISVTDSDNDGAITVNDVLYSAHKEKFTGGTEGYATEVTTYGLSMTKLWGTANAGYGYYLNNASCWSLTDTVKAGDYVAAFIYTDTVGWSDTYCYFDKKTVSANVGDAIELTLTSVGWSESGEAVTSPVADAVLTLTDSSGNTTSTTYKTDAEGKVSLKLDNAGEYTVSATSETQILVPTACKVTITASSTEASATETNEEVSKPESPKTYDRSFNLLALYVLLIFGFITLWHGKKSVNEK